MPVGAAIGAVGSVAGGVASGKGAKKAAKIQAQSQAQQTAALQAMYQTNKTLMTPTFDRGDAAQQRIQTLLGLSSGDGADVQTTLQQMPGYQFQKREGLSAVNANAYASGLGNSGAALKSLQDRGDGLASQYFNSAVSQLGSVADRGVTAMNGLVSQGNYTTSAVNQVAQTGADAQSANAVFQGQNLAGIIKGVAGAAGQAYGSSYAPKTPTSTPGYSSVFDSRGLNKNYFGGM